MSSQFRQNDYARCPYFRRESATEIRCSGLCGSATTQTFENSQGKQEWCRDFCMDMKTYEGCPMYQALAQEED